MLKDHRHTCTGTGCKVCRHLGRQRAASARKRRAGPAPVSPAASSRPATRPPAGDHGRAQ